MVKRKSKKLVHLVGEVEVPFGIGKAVVVESCNGDEPGKLDLVVPAKSGVPVPTGSKMAYFRKHDDNHYQCEVVDVDELANGGGPPQVANMSYRKGWDETFGKGRPN
jgi:hypothetical protein